MSHHTWDYGALMRARGFRVTPQRQLILDAICECGGHCTPEDIYVQVHTRAPALHRATVYRTVDFLCELRLVVAADVGGGKKVYEIAGEMPHHHLICRTCGQAEQIEHAAVKILLDKIEHDHHFKVDMDHMTLFGLCPKCRQSEKRRAVPAPRQAMAH